MVVNWSRGVLQSYDYGQSLCPRFPEIIFMSCQNLKASTFLGHSIISSKCVLLYASLDDNKFYKRRTSSNRSYQHVTSQCTQKAPPTFYVYMYASNQIMPPFNDGPGLKPPSLSKVSTLPFRLSPPRKLVFFPFLLWPLLGGDACEVSAGS